MGKLRDLGKIKKIEEWHSKSDGWGGESGYRITTDKDVITMSIANGQCCCEDWGYFMSEDDLDSFIGDTIKKVELTDTELKKGQAPDIYEGGIMFVDIVTDKSVLQFVAYNSHNGYYGHTARVTCDGLNHEEVL